MLLYLWQRMWLLLNLNATNVHKAWALEPWICKDVIGADEQAMEILMQLMGSRDT